jgi:hypothetical protein
MRVFYRLTVFVGLGFSTDAQSARLEAHLDLLPVEPRKFSACDKVFAGFGNVELHRLEEFGFCEKPILSVVSVHASPALENLKGALGDQIEYVLRMFEKLMNRYEIQIGTG